MHDIGYTRIVNTVESADVDLTSRFRACCETNVRVFYLAGLYLLLAAPGCKNHTAKKRATGTSRSRAARAAPFGRTTSEDSQVRPPVTAAELLIHCQC